MDWSERVHNPFKGWRAGASLFYNVGMRGGLLEGEAPSPTAPPPPPRAALPAPSPPPRAFLWGLAKRVWTMTLIQGRVALRGQRVGREDMSEDVSEDTRAPEVRR